MIVACNVAVGSRLYKYEGVNPIPFAVVVPRVVWNRLPLASISPLADLGLRTKITMQSERRLT
jgi:hypothetical protein